MPSNVAGKPSRMNIHCQPDKPATPAMSFMIQPEIGPPRTPAIAMPLMNIAMMRARWAPGYQ